MLMPDSIPKANNCARALLMRAFELDLRSLAALRIGIGIVLLLNLNSLLPDVRAFYTDQGMLSCERCRHLTSEEQSTYPPYWLSLHMLDGRLEWQYALFAVMAVCALAVLVGYRTQTFLFLSWALLVGLQARNPLILCGGDQLLRCLLFWCLFLPLGSRWSLAARRRSHVPAAVCSLASAALVVQLATMYVTTAVVKSDPMWHSDFTAIYYALHNDFFTTSFGYEIRQYPELARALTAATIGLEFFGPFALFLPVRGWWFRTALVAAFIGLHLGIAATMDLGLFPWTCIVYWIALLPGGFWDLLAGRARQRPEETRAGESPAPLSVPSRAILVGALIYVIALGVARCRHGLESDLQPGPFRSLGKAACLDQHWYLFAPRPHMFSGRVEVIGTRPDGSTVNLLPPDRSMVGDRPDVTVTAFSGMHWRRAIVYLFEYGDCPNLRQGFVEYFRDKVHEPLIAVRITGVMEMTPPPNRPSDATESRRALLASWSSESSSEHPSALDRK
jgi:hypothetical protein